MNLKKIIFHLITGCMMMQPLSLSAQGFNRTIYRESDGLPSGYVECSYEDSRGYLWLGTFGGLSRFDGKHFVNYGIREGLPVNVVDYITEDNKGRMWLATRAGLVMFNGRDFIHFPYQYDQGRSVFFNYLEKDEEGNIHASISTHLYTVVKDSVVEEQAPAGFKDSILFANFYIKQLQVRVIATNSSIYTITGNNKPVYLNHVSSTHFRITRDPQDPASFYYVCEAGLYRWKNGYQQKISTHDFKGEITTGFCADSKHRLWFAAESKGVRIINLQTGATDSIADVPLLVPFIHQDSHGTVWLSTFRGLIKLTESFVSHHTKDNGLFNEDIRSSGLLQDGTIYMNNNFILNGQVNDLDPAIKKYISGNKEMLFISSMLQNEKKETEIFSLFGKKYKLFNGAVHEWKEDNFLDDLNTAVTAKDGVVWFCRRDTLFRWMRNGPPIAITANSEGKKLGYIESVKRDANDRLWVRTAKMILWINGNKLIDITASLKLPANASSRVGYADSSGIWIITEGYGLIHFNYLANGQLERNCTINSENGLPDNKVRAVIADNDHYLWIATWSGICYARISNNWKQVHIRPFTEHEGFDIPNWNLSYFQKDNAGNLWLGVANGIYRIDASKIEKQSDTPRIHINNIIVSDSTDKWKWDNSATDFFSFRSSADFSYRQNNISFYFTGINLKTGYVRYSYMLEGQDREWTVNQADNMVTYRNLAPGDYVFKVTCENENGEQCSSIASFHFTIHPPFWQRWWFRILLALAAIGLIYWFIRQRDKRTVQHNNMLLQMSELRLQAVQSQMNPHFIFNSLNSIQNFILHNNQIEAARYLSRFSKLIRRILDNSHHQFLKLDEILETLKMYVELEAFRFSNEFSYSFETDTSDARIFDIELPPMLLQPFVENAILHGLMSKEGDKHLLVRSFIKDDVLYCIIEDNGVGRSGKKPEGHISRGQRLTSGMLDSLRNLQNTEATIAYEDRKDADGNSAGTKVTIQVPIQPDKN